jgi:uncharacterized protein (DUF924 family)
MSQVETILKFWFGQSDEPDYGKQKAFWFEKKPEFDAELKTWFLEDYQQAAAGHLDDWLNAADTSLALILLLDQFPRNMFRDTPQAFATDDKALVAAKHTVAQGYDCKLLPVQRWFIYLPFEHSENLSDQRLCVQLFQQLNDDVASEQAIASALRHREIIERFGRFPHRNQILGRVSTPEEEEFLQQPDSGF